MSEPKSTNAAMVLLVGALLIGPIAAMFFFIDPGTPSKKERRNKAQQRARARFQQQPVRDIEIPDEGAGQVSTALNLMVIFDGSASMLDALGSQCGGDNRFPNKHTGASWAVEQFVEQVPEDVNLGLYVFDKHGSSLRMPLEADREKFLAIIHAVTPDRGTPLAKAIRTGTNELIKQYRQQLGYGEFRLVVVTDGEAEGLTEAALYAAEMGIPIYTIGLCVSPNHVLREFSVSYTAANDFEAMSAGLADTLAELPDFDNTHF